MYLCMQKQRGVVMKEINLTEDQVKRMVTDTARFLETKIKSAPIFLVASDSYGATLHRTWVFTIETDLIVGAIERYWDGLKLICSTVKGKPRTYFFTTDGERSSSKDLKKNKKKEEE